MWSRISVHPQRFGGREFGFRSADVGNVHTGGIVDMPALDSRPIGRRSGRATPLKLHNSAWTTFRVRSKQEHRHALWLMRLSYLRYTLKTASDPRGLFEQESDQLHLSPKFRLEVQVAFPLNQCRRRSILKQSGAVG